MLEDTLSRRAFVSTAGVSVAVLAGCSSADEATDTGTPSSAGPDGTSTPTQTTDGATETSAALGDYPPGVTADSVEQPQRLIDATRTALVRNDYDVVTTLVSGSSDNEITQRYKSSLEEKRHYFKFDTPAATNTRYVENGTAYFRLTQDGETNYTQQTVEESVADLHTESDLVSMLGGREALGGIVELGRFTPAQRTEYNGRDVIGFEFDGVYESAIDGTVSDPSGNLVVASDGVVFDAALSMQVTAEQASRVYENTFTLNALGSVHVRRPSWVDEQF